MKTHKLKEALSSPLEEEATFKNEDFLSLGSVPLNLLCGERTYGGLPKGVMLWMIGHSNTGKSWLKNLIFAEAANNEEFADYVLIDDNAERGGLMDIAKFFGKRTYERIIPPSGTKANPIYSTTVQSFYRHLDQHNKNKKPFIYILDSNDALTGEKEDDAFGKSDKEKGSYNLEIPKVHSRRLRAVTNKLKETGSILVIISQTRSNIGFDAKFNPDTVAGGKALEFHARIVFWMSIRERLKKRILGKERDVGAVVQCKVTKNHVTGRRGKAEFVFFDASGVDHVGSMVRFLTEEGHWKATGGGEGGRGLLKKKVAATDIGVTLPFNNLVEYIEENNLEGKVAKIVRRVWKTIIDESTVSRKPRYT